MKTKQLMTPFLYGVLLIWSGMVHSAIISMSADLAGAPGDTVTSFITISDVAGLTIESIDFDAITYDPSVLQYVVGSGVTGSGFNSDVSPAVNDTSGSIAVAGLISFLGVVPVENAVLFQLDFLIRDGAPAGPSFQGFRIFINESIDVSGTGQVSVSAVPLPGAIWLFGSGLFAFLGVLRRRGA